MFGFVLVITAQSGFMNSLVASHHLFIVIIIIIVAACAIIELKIVQI